MDELIARLGERLGVDQRTARELVAIVIQFLAREAPPEAMAPLFAAHPWAQGLAAEVPEAKATTPSERHFGGMARLMGVADRMMALGLTMPQVQQTVRETVDYARDTVGPEPVDALVRAIPGLRQVV
ncbi:hypothetical protein EZH22_25420 [Xanthobacter dioxanivorans]|uniref:DUF2267 domain-containing protein n=1 Tax=Xanthobacter dioxanivorans TaxID=2528964 RepID=A0A974SI28_9HYPH|nr:hypothetical protein [Xanthobacter dioxanivorans]QRG06265.1 hypothetical protein EZH22_25420 [Xanthobacter dioxanivorans]